jgi:hypothetical protein
VYPVLQLLFFNFNETSCLEIIISTKKHKLSATASDIRIGIEWVKRYARKKA